MRKILMSLIMMICPMCIIAQGTTEWALVEPRSGAKILMEQVGFLLAADNDDTFSIVCNDGTIICGVQEINFTQVDPTSIEATKGSGEVPMLKGNVDGMLTLSGCRLGATVEIYDAAGRKTRSVKADGSDMTIDLTGIASGVYMLRVGNAAVKFVKK